MPTHESHFGSRPRGNGRQTARLATIRERSRGETEKADKPMGGVLLIFLLQQKEFPVNPNNPPPSPTLPLTEKGATA